MKKFLSLVLALVMTMSLVTISAGAKDFTDGSKIQYNEAVDVISELDIVDGYKDGSFNPSSVLTRGAAAKIICNLVLGPTTASALVADTAPYSDVPITNDFAGYIAYCAQQKIISGYADGTFRPGNTLTSYAFMKMLLGALGYDAEIEQYVGANWSVQVAKRALSIGLDDDLVGDFNGVKPVTREEACLYAFNTLTATMVEYGTTTTVNVSGATVTVGGSKASEVENNAVAKKQYDGEDDGKMQFCEKYFSDLKLETSEKADDFGRPSNVWYNDNDKIGTYAKSADLTYTEKVKAEKIYKDLDLSKNYDFAVVVDGVPDSNFLVTKKDVGSHKADDKVGTGDGNLIEVFEDEKIITVINTYLMQVDGDYDEDDEELTLSSVPGTGDPNLTGKNNILSADDFDNLDSFKDEDYVIVTVASGEVQTIALAEKVTGTVTEYVDDDSVTVGGKEYGYSAMASNNGGTASTFTYELKEDYDLYLDAYGNVLWADGVEDEGSYVYISEFAKNSQLTANSKVVAYAYFLDGTEDEITLNKVGGSKVNGTDADDLTPGWYRYSLKDSGKYDLSTVTNVTTSASANLQVTDYSANKTDINGTGLKGNKNTKFVIVKANDDVVTYTGIKNVADTKLGTSGYVLAAVADGSSSYAKYVFIDVGGDGTVKGGSTSSDQLFILKLDKTGTDTDDDTYYRYKAILNGEETKIKADTDAGLEAGYLHNNVEYDSKGYVTSADAIKADEDDYKFANVGGAKVTYKKNTVVFGAVASFYLADDAKIFVIEDKDDVSKVSGSKLQSDYKNGLPTGSTVTAVENADDEVIALYVWVK